MSATVGRHLAVFLDGRRVGTLEQDTNRRMSFTYAAAYPPGATPLSPALPVAGGRFTHKDVAPFILGLLPDNEQVVERWARMFHVGAGNVFALLAHVGMDCAGAVQFVPDDHLAELDEGDLEELTDDDLERMLRELRANPFTWQQPEGARGGHFSLAGAQSKFALHRLAGAWARPRGRIPTTHIFKPTIAGVDDHDVNEHLCLRAARLLGLPAARSQLLAFGEERALVVERFDRRLVDGSVRRVHQVDMCQARGVLPDLKYQSDGRPGPSDIVETLRNALAGEDDVARFVQALVFNWVIAGTDAHAKNYGLLLSGAEVRLTPLYDVASALMLPDWNAHKWELAMRINGEGCFKYLSGRHWKQFAATVGVDVALVHETFDRYTSQIGDALATATAELPAAWQSFGERFTAAVRQHAAAMQAKW